MAIAGYIAEQNLSYALSDLFLPLLITIFPYDQSLGKEDKDLFDYAFLNVLSELFQDPLFTVETVMEYRDYEWMVVLKWNHPPDTAVIESICTSFIEKANRFLRSDACCNVSVSAALEGINKSIRDLLQMNEDMIKKRNQIMFLERHSLQEAAYTPPRFKTGRRCLPKTTRPPFSKKLAGTCRIWPRAASTALRCCVYSAWIWCSSCTPT